VSLVVKHDVDAVARQSLEHFARYTPSIARSCGLHHLDGQKPANRIPVAQLQEHPSELAPRWSIGTSAIGQTNEAILECVALDHVTATMEEVSSHAFIHIAERQRRLPGGRGFNALQVCTQLLLERHAVS
jgi:hypothetical protein